MIPSPLYHNLDSSLMEDLLPTLTILRCIDLNFMISEEAFINIQERQVINN